MFWMLLAFSLILFLDHKKSRFSNFLEWSSCVSSFLRGFKVSSSQFWDLLQDKNSGESEGLDDCWCLQWARSIRNIAISSRFSKMTQKRWKAQEDWNININTCDSYVEQGVRLQGGRCVYIWGRGEEVASFCLWWKRCFLSRKEENFQIS